MNKNVLLIISLLAANHSKAVVKELTIEDNAKINSLDVSLPTNPRVERLREEAQLIAQLTNEPHPNKMKVFVGTQTYVLAQKKSMELSD